MLAGQNEVATGADTVVDLLSRTAPLLAPEGGPASVGNMPADWRQSLATSSIEASAYLGTALVRWQRHRNESHHDLSAELERRHGDRSRAWLRLRSTFNDVAHLDPVNSDGRPPERAQRDPSLGQIERFLHWATRSRGGLSE